MWAFAFDARGRLWVAIAAYTDTGRHGVYVIETPSAALLRVIVQLKTPLGLLWYEGTLKGRIGRGAVVS